MRVLLRLALALGCAALGIAVGVATVAVHERWWGLVLAVAATAATVWALPPVWYARPPFVVGWALPIALGSLVRPEGDYLVASDAAGDALLISATMLVVIAMLSWVLASGRRRRRDDVGPVTGRAGAGHGGTA